MASRPNIHCQVDLSILRPKYEDYDSCGSCVAYAVPTSIHGSAMEIKPSHRPTSMLVCRRTEAKTSMSVLPSFQKSSEPRPVSTKSSSRAPERRRDVNKSSSCPLSSSDRIVDMESTASWSPRRLAEEVDSQYLLGDIRRDFLIATTGRGFGNGPLWRAGWVGLPYKHDLKSRTHKLLKLCHS